MEPGRDPAVGADLGAPAEEEEGGARRGGWDSGPTAGRLVPHLEAGAVGEDEAEGTKVSVFAAAGRPAALGPLVVVDHPVVAVGAERLHVGPHGLGERRNDRWRNILPEVLPERKPLSSQVRSLFLV